MNGLHITRTHQLQITLCDVRVNESCAIVAFCIRRGPDRDGSYAERQQAEMLGPRLAGGAVHPSRALGAVQKAFPQLGLSICDAVGRSRLTPLGSPIDIQRQFREW